MFLRRIFLTVLTAVTCSVAADPTAEQIEFFEKKIRPVLADACYKCHSAQSEKVRGGLLLDTRAALLKGGETGPGLVPGDPKKSLLIQAVRWSEDLQMPPKEKLSASQIADLESWVKMGAPDPRDGAALSPMEKLMEEGRTHWAFQPVRKPSVPNIAGASFSNPIDAFISAKLKENGLGLSPRADSRTLVRRLYFDLIGLPPTAEEVAKFSAAYQANATNALSSLIDRLLASPRHGERWGRHWLDVARYADTMGVIFNNRNDYPYAYTYRDYVIRAFNEDKPYHQFVREQIAADLLPAQTNDNRALAALGFLTVGRRSDGVVDDDVRDDRIDVLTRGLMGMTVGCARCHDHKLEPIPTRDYYALYGVLRSSKEPEMYPELKPLADTPERQAYLKERELRRQNYASAVATNALAALSELHGRLGDYLLAAHEGGLKSTEQNKEFRSTLSKEKLSERIYNPLVARWTNLISSNVAIFTPWLELASASTNEFAAKARAITERYRNNSANDLNPIVAQAFGTKAVTNLAEAAATYNRIFATASSNTWRQFSALLADAGMLRAEDAALSAKELESVIHGRVLKAIAGITHSDANEAALHRVVAETNSPFMFKPREFVEARLVSEDRKKKIDAAAKALADAENLPGAPPRAMVLLEDKPYNAKVFLRGNPRTEGPPAPRQFLEILSGPERRPFPKESSGRLELAEAIASPENPLTARVMVNRVWQWHFGQGLVRTPSDFGLRGEQPTHPGLLDFLAAWFVENGWSLKKLHRLIVSSETYLQSSVRIAEAARRDPENRLLWRMNPRPLEFETFRDSLLSVSGRLDLSEGGRPVDLTKSNSTRRTVYALVDRKSLPNLFRNFDFPDPNFSAAQRQHSAMTPQALCLLNSPAVLEAARALASTVQPVATQQGDEAVKTLYRKVLQREPGPHEIDRALQFVAAYPTNNVVMPEATDWQYGYGDFDAAAARVSAFETLTKFSDKAVRGSRVGELDLSSLEITPEGGRSVSEKALIRRWTSPQSGRVNIYAELVHTNAAGDGVLCRLVSSRRGVLGEWRAANTNVLTLLNDVEITAGETLDFLTVCQDDPKVSTFRWSPTITMPGAEMPGMKGMAMRWDAKSNFMDPTRLPQPLGPWEEFAQVLLLSNEFARAD